MNISTHAYQVDFGMAKASLRFQSDDRLTFTITEKEGKKADITETVIICKTEIRPQLFMVTWKEKSGTTVMQIHDYENEVVYSNWPSTTGEFTNLKGILTPHVPITVQTTVHATPEQCWNIWTTPADIIQFNNPFHDWHTARAIINLTAGGSFFYRMEAKDGSTGFDFAGKYDTVIPNELIGYTGADGRKALNTFESNGGDTTVTETFEPDPGTPLELQREFCQTILNNFKKYVEEIYIS